MTEPTSDSPSDADYAHIRAYALRGMTLPADIAPLRLLDGGGGHITARLVADDDPSLRELDRRTAVANIMLESMFHGTSGEFDNRLVTAIAAAQEHRRNQHGASPYLILEKRGRTAEPTSRQQAELTDFRVVLRGPAMPPPGIPDKEARALLIGISLLAPKLLAIKKADEAFIYYSASGKPIYCYNFSGSATAYTSLAVKDDSFSTLETWFGRLLSEEGLDRVSRLLIASFEAEGDALRAFLNAWNALEILVNKLFSNYEGQFIQQLMPPASSKAQRQYVGRIRDVMKDKYRLTDKFALLASQLSPSTADTDIQAFGNAKDQRDKTLHGQVFDDSSLNALGIQELVRRYMTLHLSSGTAAVASAI